MSDTPYFDSYTRIKDFANCSTLKYTPSSSDYTFNLNDVKVDNTFSIIKETSKYTLKKDYMYITDSSGVRLPVITDVHLELKTTNS